MKISLIFFFLSSTFVGSGARAVQTENTQTLMPKAMQHEIAPGVGFMGMRYSFGHPTKVDVDSSSSQMTLKYYFGITDSHALGLETGYQSTHTTAEIHDVASSYSISDASGMSDVILKYKGSHEFPVLALYWSAGYSFNAEKSVVKDVSATETKSNVVSGQSAFLLSTAVVFPISVFKLGTSADFTFKQDGEETFERLNSSSTVYKKTGGSANQFRVFAELENMAHPNLAFVSLHTDSSESLNTTSNSSTKSLGTEALGVEISTRFIITPAIEIIPQLGYYSIQKDDLENASDLAYLTTGVSGRFLF